MSKDENNKETLLPAELQLPDKLCILPLGGLPIFPGIFTPFMVNNSDDIKVIEEAAKGEGYIGFVLLKEDKKNPSAVDLYSVGTVARIIKKINLPDGGLNLFVSTISRFKIKKIISETNPIVCAVEYLQETGGTTFEVKALTRALISEMREINEANALISDEMRMNLSGVEQPGKIADFITSILNIEKTEQQKILETLDIRRRMEKVLVFIKREQEILRVQKKIQNEINDRVEKNQREYFLREELKSIQEELGIAGDGKSSDFQKYSRKIAEFKFTGEIKETLDDELAKFQLLDPHDPEYNSSRNFLELVCALPWNDTPVEKYDLEHSRKVLDRDHYGLTDVKKRILEYLSVRRLKNDSKGAVVILVGPPGVGKTSVGRSIARCMNKEFYRFSVGGEHDEGKIKGYRRTYIGSMPGQIIQGLKITKSRSPVFLIDEVDKMNASAQGDPSAALLEVLDPEQNSSFRDTYLDLPFDLSSVFFILTANSLDTIPRPLLDRAEIIELNGYIDQEKMEIAKKYLIPKTLEKNGLKKNQVTFTKDALVSIATEYAREAGVRNFEKLLDKIIRKIVYETQTSSKSSDISRLFEKKKFTVDEKDVKKYLGIPYFDESQIKKASVPGTAIGLAWTSMGGDTLLLEAISCKSPKGGLLLTGQMGDVMKESAQIAFSWVRREAIANGLKEASWFEENSIHLHIPEGATPKDGPSAGITMATTFMSLLKNRKIRANLAMTGELSLTGQVLPIGGLREKTVAAKRNGIKTILIPKANEKDLAEIPENVKKGIKFIPVTDVREVMEAVF